MTENTAPAQTPTPAAINDPDDLEMAEMSPLAQAEKAIAYALRRFRDEPHLGWYLNSTQTFALLAEALASIRNKPVKEIRCLFVCKNAKNPENRAAVEACERIAREHQESGFEISIGAIEDAIAAVDPDNQD